MVVCSKCGSDRLIPLTFDSVSSDDKVETPKRPTAKCSKCGELTFLSAKAFRALSPE